MFLTTNVVTKKVHFRLPLEGAEIGVVPPGMNGESGNEVDIWGVIPMVISKKLNDEIKGDFNWFNDNDKLEFSTKINQEAEVGFFKKVRKTIPYRFDLSIKLKRPVMVDINGTVKIG